MGIGERENYLPFRPMLLKLIADCNIHRFQKLKKRKFQEGVLRKRSVNNTYKEWGSVYIKGWWFPLERKYNVSIIYAQPAEHWWPIKSKKNLSVVHSMYAVVRQCYLRSQILLIVLIGYPSLFLNPIASILKLSEEIVIAQHHQTLNLYISLYELVVIFYHIAFVLSRKFHVNRMLNQEVQPSL